MTVNGHGVAFYYSPTGHASSWREGKSQARQGRSQAAMSYVTKKVKTHEGSRPASPPPPAEEQGLGQPDDPLLPNATADPELEPKEAPTRFRIVIAIFVEVCFLYCGDNRASN